jgi:hypothetical protein
VFSVVKSIVKIPVWLGFGKIKSLVNLFSSFESAEQLSTHPTLESFI